MPRSRSSESSRFGRLAAPPANSLTRLAPPLFGGRNCGLLFCHRFFLFVIES
jgi:hypothetical protein